MNAAKDEGRAAKSPEHHSLHDNVLTRDMGLAFLPKKLGIERCHIVWYKYRRAFSRVSEHTVILSVLTPHVEHS